MAVLLCMKRCRYMREAQGRGRGYDGVVLNGDDVVCGGE